MTTQMPRQHHLRMDAPILFERGVVVEGLREISKWDCVISQAAALEIPLACFDFAGIVPASKLPVTIGTFERWPHARELVEKQLQVVYTPASWPNLEMFALHTATTLNHLYLMSRPSCTVLLDRACIPSLSWEARIALEQALLLLDYRAHPTARERRCLS